METLTGKDIESEENVKNLGVIVNEKLKFFDSIENIALANQVESDVMRTFALRDKNQMMKIFNVCIKRKIEYCCRLFLKSRVMPT